MKNRVIVLSFFCFLSYFNINYVWGQSSQIKYREKTEIRGDTLVYERIQKKIKRVIFSEYYKNNEPVSVWKRYDIQTDSIINLDYRFDLLYIDKIPENFLILDLKDSSNNHDIIYPKYEGDSSLNKAIYKNIIYPLFARRLGYQGTVEVLFKVEKNGNAYPIGVFKGIVPELDKEAIRVLKHLNNWHPTIVNESEVESYFLFPINFNLTYK